MALSGSGKISGQGTWRQDVSLKNPAASGIPQVEGDVVFENVAIRYPSLPAPIADRLPGDY